MAIVAFNGEAHSGAVSRFVALDGLLS